MGKRIMIIDDTKILAHSIADLLRMEGFEVTVCYSGKDAFALLNELDVDLIVSDLKMAEMDGIDITLKIRNSARLKQLPVIILTADTDKTNETAVYSAGANLLLHKPFEEDELIKSISKLTDTNDKQD
jgi:DNA-binding response OmpR family regulator